MPLLFSNAQSISETPLTGKTKRRNKKRRFCDKEFEEVPPAKYLERATSSTPKPIADPFTWNVTGDCKINYFKNTEEVPIVSGTKNYSDGLVKNKFCCQNSQKGNSMNVKKEYEMFDSKIQKPVTGSIKRSSSCYTLEKDSGKTNDFAFKTPQATTNGEIRPNKVSSSVTVPQKTSVFYQQPLAATQTTIPMDQNRQAVTTPSFNTTQETLNINFVPDYKAAQNTTIHNWSWNLGSNISDQFGFNRILHSVEPIFGEGNLYAQFYGYPTVTSNGLYDSVSFCGNPMVREKKDFKELFCPYMKK
ncbi:hypothetical protein GWI33_007371 [Rhynchophorus ferrugineus]|uniref:Uncharacterized protein n=1 Tax=Rhynchophorus ferrugineus TaxID=354439 RepID=A0A834ITC2_RHYFE|nr:hypothetical protein GWI33_007371 [Rhynchophorus ferrugineus]